tara:strand:- start:25347 stop:25733 length:387 start_codon:yes stop_codon:yes gene_type:complete
MRCHKVLYRQIKKILTLLLIALLSGCVEHHDLDDFEITDLTAASAELKLIAEGSNGLIETSKWPEYFKEMNAISIRKDTFGIYINLDTFFVQESGLYIHLTGDKPEKSGSDPDYKYLQDNIYSYVFSG